jgi:signal transduction histidine kinase
LLHEAIDQMQEFSYSMSHDLRSPLRAMRTYSEALLTDHADQLDDQGRQLLQRIAKSGARMDQLIQDLLSYSQVSRQDMQLAPVSLDRLVGELAQQYPELNPEHVDMEVIGTLGSVIAHESSLTQVLANLLENGVKFVKPGTRPRLQIRSEKAPGNGRLRVWVEDNGIAIKPEYQKRIFGLFERLHNDRQFEGTGIGLAIVRKAMERMNGAVGVVSDGANGSRFWIELPLPVS